MCAKVREAVELISRFPSSTAVMHILSLLIIFPQIEQFPKMKVERILQALVERNFLVEERLLFLGRRATGTIPIKNGPR